MLCDDLSSSVLDVRGISKCYRIYEQPIDRLKQVFAKKSKSYFKEFWALNDINFSIERGETLGIIGRNGSGKSTLLQIICGTLTPTSGRVNSCGRIAALLELGAGFNPEFTGIENIRLSALLYGLTEEEINDRINDIVAFADIGEHVFQPVKNYSSGMYVRLAFAVIAHVDADILVIDEALAVGDAAFTQKCMRFIRKFRETGTLIFVSHDMGSVLNLCDRAIWLERGKIRETGSAKKVSQNYLKATLQDVYGEESVLRDEKKLGSDNALNSHEEKIDKNASGYRSHNHFSSNLDESTGWRTGAGEIISVELNGGKFDSSDLFKGGESLTLKINAIANQEINRPILGFLLRDRLGQDLFGENTLSFTQNSPMVLNAGDVFYAEFTFRLPMLPNGQYTIMASFADGDLFNNVQHHWLHEAVILNVSSSNVRWGLVGVPFERVHMTKEQR